MSRKLHRSPREEHGDFFCSCSLRQLFRRVPAAVPTPRRLVQARSKRRRRPSRGARPSRTRPGRKCLEAVWSLSRGAHPCNRWRSRMDARSTQRSTRSATPASSRSTRERVGTQGSDQIGTGWSEARTGAGLSRPIRSTATVRRRQSGPGTRVAADCAGSRDLCAPVTAIG